MKWVSKLSRALLQIVSELVLTLLETRQTRTPNFLNLNSSCSLCMSKHCHCRIRHVPSPPAPSCGWLWCWLPPLCFLDQMHCSGKRTYWMKWARLSNINHCVCNCWRLRRSLSSLVLQWLSFLHHTMLSSVKTNDAARGLHAAGAVCDVTVCSHISYQKLIMGLPHAVTRYALHTLSSYIAQSRSAHLVQSYLLLDRTPVRIAQ